MTFFETSGQGAVFLLLLYAGAASGVLYDLIAPFRRRAPRPAAILLDAAWCLLTAGLCFFALTLGGEKEMRIYALLGLCCGAGVYSLGVRRLGQWTAGILRKLMPRPAQKKEKPAALANIPSSPKEE